LLSTRFLKKSDDGNWYDVGDRTAAEKTSQGLRERTNAEKRQRSQLRRALRLRKEDLEEDEKEGENAGTQAKKAKGQVDAVVNLAATLAPTLNYVGPNLHVPLSLNMGQPASQSRKKPEPKTKLNPLGLNTAGLPPNAVDEEGNILVTDYDILVGGTVAPHVVFCFDFLTPSYQWRSSGAEVSQIITKVQKLISSGPSSRVWTLF
jgi:hypothetical protein